jgi:hypothetical protein
VAAAAYADVYIHLLLRPNYKGRDSSFRLQRGQNSEQRRWKDLSLTGERKREGRGLSMMRKRIFRINLAMLSMRIKLD